MVHEPGLRIIRGGGPAPWEDRLGFFDSVIRLSLSDLERQFPPDEPVFFDRGLFDALSGRAEREKVPLESLMPPPFPYTQPVFFAPPWPEIFEQTEERPHTYEVALDEALRLRRDLDALGLKVVELPKVSVEHRADIVLAAMNAG